MSKPLMIIPIVNVVTAGYELLGRIPTTKKPIGGWVRSQRKRRKNRRRKG